jgi:hypothetical protein
VPATNVSDVIRQAQAALSQADNATHRRGLAEILRCEALSGHVAAGQREEAIALAALLLARN